MGVLLHELNKRKIMPLRKLFKTIPNLLLKLKPCLMMSPLSVSYFLEAETYKFDMVIFDEASQIFPQDAIGAICRGKQVIIAGDSKQLPPTSFLQQVPIIQMENMILMRKRMMLYMIQFWRRQPIVCQIDLYYGITEAEMKI